MPSVDQPAVSALVCAVTRGAGSDTSLDTLLRALVDLDNLCLLIVGDTAGLGLPETWAVVQQADGFQPVGRQVVVGASDADAVFGDIAQRFGARAIGVRLGQAGPTSAMFALIEAGGVMLIEGDAGAASQEADLIGTVEDLSATIVTLCRRAESRTVRLEPLSTQETREVCDLLREATGHDFKHYKETTLSRRILRRIHVLRCDTLYAYLDLLKSSADEARALMRDLLIGVTAFFRDPDAFAALNAKAIKPLMKRENQGVVRIWVAGCSTGPEAYTMAMLVREWLDDTGQDREVQIFATDLDERALNVARKGIYPAGMVEPLGPDRVARHFTKIAGRYSVNKSLRQMIFFSPHNLIADPPFSRMDMIACRNVMIYLGPHLQKKLISVFHYALRDSGYLFLGSSEVVTGHGDLFRVVDSRARIAQRKDVGARAPGPRQPTGGTTTPWQTNPGGPDQSMAAITQRILLDEFAPPYLIASEDGQITYASARVGAFLEVPEGQFVNNLIRVVRSGIRTGMRAAWSGALKTRRKTVHEGLTMGADKDRRRTRIVVQPMPDLGEDTGTYMVVFFDLGQVAGTDSLIATSTDSERLFADLEAELLQAREELERSVQDLEGANEELKSSNEELLSMNEELQSANEELESSKDEIERAATALEDANTDLVNLLQSTQIATIFLDGTGNLRRFTPAASAFYNITPDDIGRPLAHFTHHFEALPTMPAQDSLEGAVEDEAVRRDGRSFLRRVTPYATESGKAAGIVVTFVDMTSAKQAEARIRRSREQLRLVTDTAPVMIAQIDADLRYSFVNRAFAVATGHEATAMIGMSVADAMGATGFALAEPHIRTVLAGQAVNYDMELDWNGAPLCLTVNCAPEFDANGRVIGFVAASLDVTAAKQAERDLLASEARFRASQQASPHGFLIFRALRDAKGVIEDFMIDYANDSSLRLMGRPAEDVVGVRLLTAFPGNRDEGLFAQYADVAETGKPLRLEVPYENEGMTGWFEITAVQVDDGLAVLWDNITARKHQERQIAGNAQRLRNILNGVVAFVGAVSPDGLLTEANQPALDVAGLKRDDVIGKPFWEAFWWSHDPEVQAQCKRTIELAAQGKTSRFDVKIRVAAGQFLFIDYQIAPMLDEAGRVTELIPSAVDITDRLHAEDAVLRSAERLSSTLDTVETLVGLLGIDGTVRDVNATALAHLDVPKTDLLGMFFADMPLWKATDGLAEQIARMIETAKSGNRCREDVPFLSIGGAVRWLDFTIAPVLHADGVASALVWSGSDITDRRASERALAESRDRLSIATSAARLGTFDMHVATGVVALDARAKDLLGLTDRAVTMDALMAHVHPEDQARMAAETARNLVLSPGDLGTSAVYRFNRPDGRQIWVEGHSTVHARPEKTIIGTFQDVTDRQNAESRQKMLLDELNHRVKNSLATIQSIASHTLRHAASPEAFREAFGGRLAAIAAAHDILVGNQQTGADLNRLLESQIGPYASFDRGQVERSGPPVALGPAVAHALGLVLHELATNASKYGALSIEAGVLNLSWSLEDRDSRRYLKIDWTEQNGPPVAEPTRRGFGSRLIEMTLKHTLDGEFELNYNPTGFSAKLLMCLEE